MARGNSRAFANLKSMAIQKGYWNGEPAEFRVVLITVGPEPEHLSSHIAKHSPGLKRYLWFVPFIGKLRQAIQVIQGSDVFYLDNEDGSGFEKVTIGMGSPKWAHRSVYSEKLVSHIPDDKIIAKFSQFRKRLIDEQVQNYWLGIDPEGYRAHMEMEKIEGLKRAAFGYPVITDKDVYGQLSLDEKYQVVTGQKEDPRIQQARDQIQLYKAMDMDKEDRILSEIQKYTYDTSKPVDPDKEKQYRTSSHESTAAFRKAINEALDKRKLDPTKEHNDFTKSIQKEDEERNRWFLWIKKTVLRIRDGKLNPVYLIRYSLLTTPWFSVKLHRIFISDDDCMHDHPWSFISIILWGGYIEHRPSGSDVAIWKNSVIEKRLYGPGSILWRPCPSIHKLEIFQPATTLVITFKRQREWGFWTKDGWKEWYKYIRSGAKC